MFYKMFPTDQLLTGKKSRVKVPGYSDQLGQQRCKYFSSLNFNSRDHFSSSVCNNIIRTVSSTLFLLSCPAALLENHSKGWCNFQIKLHANSCCSISKTSVILFQFLCLSVLIICVLLPFLGSLTQCTFARTTVVGQNQSSH